METLPSEVHGYSGNPLAPIQPLEAPVKRGRGRPKGSKNKPKDGTPIPAPVAPVVEEKPVEIVPVNGHTCQDCTAFLTCKKFKGEDGNICDKFEDNFPPEEPEEVIEDEPEEPVILHKCNKASEKCLNCPHAVPHDPTEYTEDNPCTVSEECETFGGMCQCVPV